MGPSIVNAVIVEVTVANVSTVLTAVDMVLIALPVASVINVLPIFRTDATIANTIVELVLAYIHIAVDAVIEVVDIWSLSEVSPEVDISLTLMFIRLTSPPTSRFPAIVAYIPVKSVPLNDVELIEPASNVVPILRFDDTFITSPLMYGFPNVPSFAEIVFKFNVSPCS